MTVNIEAYQVNRADKAIPPGASSVGKRSETPGDSMSRSNVEHRWLETERGLGRIMEDLKSQLKGFELSPEGNGKTSKDFCIKKS